jgi:hypothetical protein
MSRLVELIPTLDRFVPTPEKAVGQRWEGFPDGTEETNALLLENGDRRTAFREVAKSPEKALRFISESSAFW